MAETMSFAQLENFLEGKRDEIHAIIGDLGAIQERFVSAHQESKDAHDRTLAALSAQAVEDLFDLPPDVKVAIGERVGDERQTLEERRDALRADLIPDEEEAADALLSKAQLELQEMRKFNPLQDWREEKLKAQRIQMEAQLEELNTAIRAHSGCLKSLVNFVKIIELDRQRQRLLGSMASNESALRDVRQDWAKKSREFSESDVSLRDQWQTANLDAARLRDELAQLDDDNRRENLAWQRAAFYVLDNWKTPCPDGGGSLAGQVNQMVDYNITTDNFQEGLGKTAGLIALLGGVRDGLGNIEQSVHALIKEQKMHSAYLKPVKARLDQEVIDFHARWSAFRDRVGEQKALETGPVEFSAMFDHEVEGWLSKPGITRMFDALGRSLDSATSGWRG